MKKKLFLILIIGFILGLKINVKIGAKEEKNDGFDNSKIYVVSNVVNIEMSEIYGYVNIENEYFNASYDFMCYSLEKSAISYNTIIFKSLNENVIYLGLDYEENTFNYILNINDKIYYSSIQFNDLNTSLDFSNVNVKEYLMDESKISHTSNKEDYLLLRKMSYSYYSFFKKNNHNYSQNTRDINLDTMTGNGKGELVSLINGLALDISELETEGIHYGVQMTSLDDFILLDKIYVLETYYDSIWEEYFTYMKIWDINYSVTIFTEFDIEINVSIEDDSDILISESGYGYKEAVEAKPGYSFLEINDFSFYLTTYGTSYIYYYSPKYKSEEDVDYFFFDIVNELIGCFLPYYGNVEAGVTILDNIHDHLYKIDLNEDEDGYIINNGDDTARKLGFSVNTNSVENGLIFESNLENYSFDSTYFITNNQGCTYGVNMFFEIGLVSDYYTPISYSWNFNSNGKACIHELNYQYYSNTQHIVECQECDYKFYQIHDVTYNNLDSYHHSVQCDYCSTVENHSLVIGSNGNYCQNCDYFVSTLIRYISNRNGYSHTVKSGGLTKQEMCIGMKEDSKTICIKCRQEMNSGTIVSASINSDIYAEEIDKKRKRLVL